MCRGRRDLRLTRRKRGRMDGNGEYLNIREAAEVIGCSVDCAFRLCQKGRLPGAKKIKVRWAIPVSSAQNCPKPNSGPGHAKHERDPINAEGRPRIDMTGQKFGYLTVLSFAYMRYTSSYWNCRCELCGTVKPIARSLLINGYAVSCGCKRASGKKRGAGRTTIKPGDVFSRLTVIERAPTPEGKKGVFWRCRCECGNEVVVWGGSLPRGHTRSCGCLKKNKTSGA